MPLSYGGGVNSLELCSNLFKVGYDKVIIRNKLSDLDFLNEIGGRFGQQAISGCFEIVYSPASGELSVNSKNMSLSFAVDHISKLANNYIGEVILNFRELEGTRLGLPYNLVIKKIEEAINSPIVITGGASSKGEAINYLKDHPRLSVAASSIFTLQPPNDAVLISY
jgi:cyclase